MGLDLSMLDEPAPGGSGAVAPSGVPLMVPLSMLVEDADQPRTVFDPEKLKELAEDIKARGILQPIIVKPLDNGKHVIRFGARRYRASQLAGLKEVPCFVATDARQFDSYAQVAENNQREDLSPVELAAFIQGRLAIGEKKTVIAEGLNIKAPAVTYLCALIDAPAFLMELYHSGKCRTPEYLYRLRGLYEKNAELVERSAAAADDITRPWLEDLAAAVNGTIKVAPPAAAAPPAVAPPPEPPDDTPPARDPSEPDPSKVKYKIIMVKHDGRPAQLMLNRRASAIGLGWIKYGDDGHEVEIDLGTAVLDSLIEG